MCTYRLSWHFSCYEWINSGGFYSNKSTNRGFSVKIAVKQIQNTIVRVGVCSETTGHKCIVIFCRK